MTAPDKKLRRRKAGGKEGRRSAVREATELISVRIDALARLREQAKILAAEAKILTRQIAKFGSCQNKRYVAYVIRSAERWVTYHKKASVTITLKKKVLREST